MTESKEKNDYITHIYIDLTKKLKPLNLLFRKLANALTILAHNV